MQLNRLGLLKTQVRLLNSILQLINTEISMDGVVADSKRRAIIAFQDDLNRDANTLLKLLEGGSV